MDKIHNFLINIGVNASTKGFDYLHDAIEVVMEGDDQKHNICGMYDYIASNYEDATQQQVERCIRNAVKSCFKKCSRETLLMVFGESNAKLGKITNGDFIAICALYLKDVV